MRRGSLYVMDVQFKTPANFYTCGQTQCGKSYMARGMLQHLDKLFYLVPTKIKYCYGEYQKEFGELPSNVFGKLSEGLRCLISSGILYTYLNSSREQLRKIHQL